MQYKRKGGRMKKLISKTDDSDADIVCLCDCQYTNHNLRITKFKDEDLFFISVSPGKTSGFFRRLFYAFKYLFNDIDLVEVILNKKQINDLIMSLNDILTNLVK